MLDSTAVDRCFDREASCNGDNGTCSSGEREARGGGGGGRGGGQGRGDIGQANGQQGGW